MGMEPKIPKPTPAINWQEVNEKERTYAFPGGDRLTLENVVRVEVRDSGKHRVETKAGGKFFVSPTWLWLEIEVGEWTF